MHKDVPSLLPMRQYRAQLRLSAYQGQPCRRKLTACLVLVLSVTPAYTQVPAAEWMQGVLQVSQTAAALESARQAEQLTALYARYSLFAHALLSTAVKMWSQGTAAEMKRHLALPPQKLVEAFTADTR